MTTATSLFDKRKRSRVLSLRRGRKGHRPLVRAEGRVRDGQLSSTRVGDRERGGARRDPLVERDLDLIETAIAPDRGDQRSGRIRSDRERRSRTRRARTRNAHDRPIAPSTEGRRRGINDERSSFVVVYVIPVVLVCFVVSLICILYRLRVGVSMRISNCIYSV